MQWVFSHSPTLALRATEGLVYRLSSSGAVNHFLYFRSTSNALQSTRFVIITIIVRPPALLFEKLLNRNLLEWPKHNARSCSKVQRFIDNAQHGAYTYIKDLHLKDTFQNAYTNLMSPEMSSCSVQSSRSLNGSAHART